MCNKLLVFENDFYDLYYDKGIYIKKNYSSPALVLKDAYRDFDAAISQDGVIHIICQNLKGDIIYLKSQNKGFESRTLLLSKSGLAYNKNFRLIVSGELVLAFYSILKDSKTMLVFHNLTSDSRPEIIDYINPAPQGFFIYANNNSDINVYYTKEDLKMGIAKYTWSKKAFEPFKIIATGGICPRALDSETIIFLKDGKLYSKQINENEEEKLLCPFNCDTAPVCFKKYVFFKKSGIAYFIDTTRPKAAERLLMPESAELFEIKSGFNKCDFLYGVRTKDKINFLAPVPVSLKDFLKKQPENDGDMLKLILQKLEKIERILKGM